MFTGFGLISAKSENNIRLREAFQAAGEEVEVWQRGTFVILFSTQLPILIGIDRYTYRSFKKSLHKNTGLGHTEIETHMSRSLVEGSVSAFDS